MYFPLKKCTYRGFSVIMLGRQLHNLLILLTQAVRIWLMTAKSSKHSFFIATLSAPTKADYENLTNLFSQNLFLVIYDLK